MRSDVPMAASPSLERSSEAVADIPVRSEIKITPLQRIRHVLAIPEVGILIPLVGITLIFYCINPALLNIRTITAVLRGLAFVGIMAIGQSFLMISGELDLSVGSVAGLSAIVSAWMMMHQVPLPIALAIGILTGAGIGVINGFLAVWIGLPAFIATMGMMYVAKGVNYLISGGIPIYPLPDALNSFGRATPLGTSWALVIFVALGFAGDFVLRRTIYGRAICATGGNPEVARIAGINTHRVKIICYVLSGALTALAGLLQMAQFNVGQPEIGSGSELNVIASVVIGGVSLFGGMGTILGTLLGLLMLQIVNTGLVLSGINANWQTVAIGLIIIAAVFVDLIRRRAKVR